MAFKVFLGIFLVISLLSSTSAFIVLSTGECPNIPIQPTFDLNRYLGLWFSYENFDAPFQFGAKCISALYSLKENGNIRVVNSGLREVRIFGRTLWTMPDRIVGEASIADPSSSAAGLNVQFGGQPDMGGSGPNYKIIETDYDNYSLVYSCSKPVSYLPIKIEFAWILTRKRFDGISQAKTDELKDMMRSYGIDTDNFKKVDHSRC